jgi:hypothetical protein
VGASRHLARFLRVAGKIHNAYYANLNPILNQLSHDASKLLEILVKIPAMSLLLSLEMLV